MSRFQGYVGIANYMGARFTATEAALAPVLKEAARRGLIYIDDGSSPRSLAGQIAGANNLPFAKAEIVLDAVPTPRRSTGRWTARSRWRATAAARSAWPRRCRPRSSASPQWAKAAEGRGIVLVPISAVAQAGRSRVRRHQTADTRGRMTRDE